MNAPAVLGVAVAIVSLGTAAFSVDARYLKQAEAKIMLAEMARDDERSTLETRMELNQLKLKLLLRNERPSGDERAEIDYLKAAILEIRKRLDEINRSRTS